MDHYFKFLNDLRDSGEINMWGATPYLVSEFNVSRLEAKAILMSWIASFK